MKKIDLADAKLLGELDARGRAAGAEVMRLTEEYHREFRRVCQAMGLDPDRVGLDFDTGDVFERVS